MGREKKNIVIAIIKPHTDISSLIGALKNTKLIVQAKETFQEK